MTTERDLPRLPEIHDALRGRWHQAGEIHPRDFEVGRRRRPVRTGPKQDQRAHGRPFEADGLAGDQDRIVTVAGVAIFTPVIAERVATASSYLKAWQN